MNKIASHLLLFCLLSLSLTSNLVFAQGDDSREARRRQASRPSLAPGIANLEDAIKRTDLVRASEMKELHKILGNIASEEGIKFIFGDIGEITLKTFQLGKAIENGDVLQIIGKTGEFLAAAASQDPRFKALFKTNDLMHYGAELIAVRGRIALNELVRRDLKKNLANLQGKEKQRIQERDDILNEENYRLYQQLLKENSAAKDSYPQKFQEAGGKVEALNQVISLNELSGLWIFEPTGEPVTISSFNKTQLSFTLNGVSWNVSGNDEVYTETKRLSQREANAVYSATPIAVSAKAAAIGIGINAEIKLTPFPGNEILQVLLTAPVILYNSRGSFIGFGVPFTIRGNLIRNGKSLSKAQQSKNWKTVLESQGGRLSTSTDDSLPSSKAPNNYSKSKPITLMDWLVEKGDSEFKATGFIKPRASLIRIYKELEQQLIQGRKILFPDFAKEGIKNYKLEEYYQGERIQKTIAYSLSSGDLLNSPVVTIQKDHFFILNWQTPDDKYFYLEQGTRRVPNTTTAFLFMQGDEVIHRTTPLFTCDSSSKCIARPNETATNTTEITIDFPSLEQVKLESTQIRLSANTKTVIQISFTGKFIQGQLVNKYRHDEWLTEKMK